MILMVIAVNGGDGAKKAVRVAAVAILMYNLGNMSSYRRYGL